MTIPILKYDPAEDARRSYEAAIAAKKARGDTSWPDRAPLDHVPVTVIRRPNWMAWAAIIACALFWAAVLWIIGGLAA